MQIRELLDELLTSLETGPLISAVRHFEAKPAVFAPFPSSLDPRIVEALKARGVEQLYSHQAKAFEAVAKGEHLVVVTPTASGKTLCYNLPVLQALVQQPEARVLYLFPTKALAQDQLAELTELAKSLPDMRMFTYDGDTPQDARRSVRARANLVLTNPDMLHSGILPHHTKWVNLFQNLKYVVIDELHAYRGVFGSHLANVLRRLKRICRHYGATPQFIMASATIANPGDLAQRLTGERVVELDRERRAHRGEDLHGLQPAGGQSRARHPGALSRRGLQARGPLPEAEGRHHRVLPEPALHRGGAVLDQEDGRGQDRRLRHRARLSRRLPAAAPPREVEQGLRSGEVLGVVSTSALELGIDIGHLDLAVLAGYPGTIASMWQQAGRAGRRTGESAAVMVATSSPMDQYLAAHPDYLFGAPPEHARINPENPFILINHVKCAAFELPLGADEAFGGDVSAHLAALEDEGVLHRAGEHFHWSSETYPADHISLRTVTSDNFLVIDTTARDQQQVKRRQIIAEVDWKSAFAMIYPKAIYMVEGEPFEVQELHYREDEEKVAYVKKVVVDYFTDAITAKGVWILQRFGRQETPGLLAEQGEVLVAEKVVGFKKIKMGTLENVGSGEVELPQQEMQTTSAWLTLDPDLLAQISPRRDDLVDGLRALSHLLHSLAPIFLLCDIRDVGSWLGDGSPSQAGQVVTRETMRAQLLQGETFTPTIYLYDNQPGGIGLAERIFEVLPEMLARGLETLEACGCRSGCPSCVGPVNEVGRQAKPVARNILTRLVPRR